MIEVISIDTPALGDRSYLATDGRVALVVDPQRDIDRVLAAAAARGVRITHVFETHIHNDYVSGGLALARATGAAYHVNAADEVAFDRVPVTDGDAVAVGGTMPVQVIATPGHTFTHLSYVLQDTGTGRRAAVFTGGSLLYGSTGRPDLLGPAHAGHAGRGPARLRPAAGRRAARSHAGLPHAWLRQLLLGHRRPAGTGLHDRPGEAGQPGADARRGRVRRRTAGRPGRLSGVLRAHGPGQRGRAGRARPGPARPRRRRRSWPPDRRRRVGGGPAAAGARSPPGTSAGQLSFEHGDDFTTYLGWLIPWGAPLTLLGDTPEQVAAAQRDLARIGIDQLAGAAAGGPAGVGGRPAAGHLPGGQLRRSGRGPAPPAGHRPGCAPGAGMGRRPPRRRACTSRCRTCRPGWARSRRARSGCTARSGYRAAIARFAAPGRPGAPGGRRGRRVRPGRGGRAATGHRRCHGTGGMSGWARRLFPQPPAGHRGSGQGPAAAGCDPAGRPGRRRVAGRARPPGPAHPAQPAASPAQRPAAADAP